MIEKLVYVASQYPGEEILREVLNKFDTEEHHIDRWYWGIQITNIILLIHLLEQHLRDQSAVADLSALIQRELMETGNGNEVRVGEYVVATEELRYLVTRGLDADARSDTNTLARLMLEYRLPKMLQALEESSRNQALDSLPPDYGQMTYLVLEFLKQVKGHELQVSENMSLVAALEGLFEDFYRHIDAQIREYFSTTPLQ